MRTLGDIIEAAKSNSSATEEEFRYALCVMDAQSTFDTMDLRHLCSGKMKADGISENRYYRWKRALETSPKDYLGDSYDPANPDYQKRRAVSLKIAEKFLKKELKNEH